MKKKAKKLVLAKETVRDLMNSKGLEAVAGGAPTNFVTCGISCHYYETCYGC